MFWDKKTKAAAAVCEDLENFKRIVNDTIAKVGFIYIAAVGDDAHGGSIHVSEVARTPNGRIDMRAWAERAQRKVHKLSFVRVSVDGNDMDGDHREQDILFHDAAGADFIRMFASSPEFWLVKDSICLQIEV